MIESWFAIPAAEQAKRYPIKAPLPPDEAERLDALRRYEILDTLPEQSFDDLALLASQICGAPVALISLIDTSRQWFKSKLGISEREEERDSAFCAHGILQRDLFVVEDAQADPRFADNPWVTGAHKIRFYAGAPIVTPDGQALGMLCIKDQVPRELSEPQREALRALSRQVMALLELRRVAEAHRQSDAHSHALLDALYASELTFRRLFEAAQDGVLILDYDSGCVVDVNPFLTNLLGYSGEEMIGKTIGEISPFQDLASNESMREQLKERGYVRYEDLPLETRDGRSISVEFVSNVYEVGSKRVIQCNVRDMTDRKASQIVQARLASIVTSSDDAIIGKDLNGIVTSWNQGAEKLFGYTAEEMVGTSIMRVIPEDRLQEEDHILETIRRGETVDHFETVRQTKDGHSIYVSITVSPIRDSSGKCVGVSKVARDITAAKQNEAKARSLAESQASILNALPAHVALLNHDGMIVTVNDSWRTFGFRNELKTPDSYVGQNYIHVCERAVGPRSREAKAVAEGIKQVLNGERGDFGLEYPCHSPTAKRWFLLRVVPLGEDQMAKAVVMHVDISERKRAELQIAEQAGLLDKARDSIVALDLENKVLYWNQGAERMYGWTRDEVMGKNVSELFYKRIQKFEEVQKLSISDGGWSGELVHLTKDKREITVESRRTLICDDEGQPKSVLIINTDITEKKKIESQFMRAQRMESIGTLAGGVAHDLNNILAPIMMSIDVLKDECTSPHALGILDTIETSAKRGADIVRQVLSFARGVDGDRVEIQPRHLLGEMGKIIKDTFPKDIQLKFCIPNDTWTILGDPTQVHQILLNLCVNARDAMPYGGNLSISVENSIIDDQFAAMNLQARPGHYVQVKVSDTGTGIPPQILEKIFEPFFTTKDLSKGTGLGLSTVNSIVKSHDGFISVYSEVGKGTSFNVYLPATQHPDEPGPVQTEPPSLPHGNGETILVVDDEASILDITSKTLLAFGYRVLQATDGADALVVYSRHRHEIAVVLTDMMMPYMDGRAFIHALKRLDLSVKIIAASGLNADTSAARATEIGVNHFLTKPYTTATMLTALQAVLHES